MIKVLLVEDTLKISNNIIDFFKEDFEVVPVYTVTDAQLFLLATTYDLVILDLMLPDGDGMQVLHFLRQKKMDVGVIILTAKESIGEKLKAFENGAMDYLIKPFFMEELKVRMNLILKNKGKISESNNPNLKNLILDLKNKTAAIDNHTLNLNEKTYHLLEYLLLNKNILLYKEQIYDRICGIDSDASMDIVEVYMSRLRKQLVPFGYDQYLITRRGMGYLMNEKGGTDDETERSI